MRSDKQIATDKDKSKETITQRRWSIGTILLMALCAVLSLVVVAIAAVIVWLGPIVEAYIEKHDAELVGRNIAMDNLSVKLLSGHLSAENVVLYENDNSAEFVRLGSMEADIDMKALLDHHIYVTQVSVDAPYINIEQENETFNFDTLISYLLEHYATEDDEVSEGELWRVTIEDVALADGVVLYRDVVLDQEWKLSALSLSTPCIYLDDATTEIEASMLINDCGTLSGLIGVNISTLDFAFNGALENFDIADTYKYIKPVVNVQRIDGAVSADYCHIEGNINDILAVGIDGRIGVTDFVLLGPDGENIFSTDNFNILIDYLNIAECKYHFGSITAEGYSTQLCFEKDGSTNFDHLFYDTTELSIESSAEELGDDMYDVKERVTLTTAETEAPLKDVDLWIGTLDLRRGSVRYADNTMHEPFDYMLRDISVQSKGLTLDNKNKVTLRAQLPKQGTAMLQWEGSLEDFYNQSILAMLSNVDMQALSTYVEHYTAFPVTSGNLTLRSQNVVTNGRLSGVNQLGTYNFNVGDKDKSIDAEYDMPVKLGLYVLTDREKHIDVELPISGDISSPEFSLRKVIWQAIGNVFLKIAASPFEWMARDKQDAFRHIDIDLLSPGLDSEHYARIDTMVNTLKGDAKLAVRLNPRVNYNKAVRRLSELNLKIAYYNATEGRESGYLDLLDFARINDMKLSGSDIRDFADSMLLVRGIEPSHMNTQAKAQKLYGDMVDEQLVTMINMRNGIISRYVSFQHKDLPADRFTLETVTLDELKQYEGKDRYTVTLIIDDEEVEIKSEDEASDNNITDESFDGDTSVEN